MSNFAELGDEYAEKYVCFMTRLFFLDWIELFREHLSIYLSIYFHTTHSSKTGASPSNEVLCHIQDSMFFSSFICRGHSVFKTLPSG